MYIYVHVGVHVHTWCFISYILRVLFAVKLYDKHNTLDLKFLRNLLYLFRFIFVIFLRAKWK